MACLTNSPTVEYICTDKQSILAGQVHPSWKVRWPANEVRAIRDISRATFSIYEHVLAPFGGSLITFSMYLRTVTNIHRNFAKVIPQLISMLSSQCRLSRFFSTLSRMSLKAPHVVVENEGLNLSVKVLRFSTSTDLGSIFMNSLKRLESEIKNTKRHFEWGMGLLNINLFHKLTKPHRSCFGRFQEVGRPPTTTQSRLLSSY